MKKLIKKSLQTFLIIAFVAVIAASIGAKVYLAPNPNIGYIGNQPAPIAPSCDYLREVPIPSGPQQQMINSFRMFDRYIAYDLMLQSSYSQSNLILLDMGRDKRLFTADDLPMKLVTDTIDSMIPDMDLSNNTLVWTQSTPGIPYLELKRCNIASCESNADLVFTRNSQYDLGNSVKISNNKIMYEVYDYINRRSGQIGFCDLNLNGQNGGCLSTDQQQVINLNPALGEYISQIKTTENFGYVVTRTNTPHTARIYIINYRSLTYSLYYDEAIDQVEVVDFDVAAQQQGIDVLYLLSNNNIAASFITTGTELFSGRTNLIFGTTIEGIAADRNSNSIFEFAYLERNSRYQSYSLKTFVPFKSYVVDRSTYNQLTADRMQYSGSSFVTMDNNNHPAYMYCN